jgi:hypothetical protein
VKKLRPEAVLIGASSSIDSGSGIGVNSIFGIDSNIDV